MKMKKIIAIIFAMVGILSSGAVETLASPLVVEKGSSNPFAFFNIGSFSGDNLLSPLSIPEAVTCLRFPGKSFNTGILVAGFGQFLGAPSNAFIPGGTAHTDRRRLLPAKPVRHPWCPRLRWRSDVHQPAAYACTEFAPGVSFTREAPFTMTGQLVLGRLGLRT